MFIPLAEETGLVAGIDAWVLEEACRQLVDWNGRRAKTGDDPLRLAVNVCGRQLTQPGLLDVVDRMLDKTGLDPAWLTLEITESVLVQDPTAARMRLEGLKELGLRVAVDDFGTGYSSLAYLQKFPLDSIKIDQVFVADLTPGAAARDTTIIESIVSLAHALDFEVVAEGVQTPRAARDADRARLRRRAGQRGVGTVDGGDGRPLGDRPHAQSSSLSTRFAFSRRNFGQTSSLKPTFGMSVKIRSSDRPIGKYPA